MTGKFLGKITSAEFGKCPDYPQFVGIQFKFRYDCFSEGCGGKYTVNLHEKCIWSKEERAIACMNSFDEINKILKAAKCNYVSQLVGKPIEITVDGNSFKDFRILTEVL